MERRLADDGRRSPALRPLTSRSLRPPGRARRSGGQDRDRWSSCGSGAGVACRWSRRTGARPRRAQPGRRSAAAGSAATARFRTSGCHGSCDDKGHRPERKASLRPAASLGAARRPCRALRGNASLAAPRRFGRRLVGSWAPARKCNVGNIKPATPTSDRTSWSVSTANENRVVKPAHQFGSERSARDRA